jgi:antitoxin MazE
MALEDIMKTRVHKWGNSLALRIPKPYATEVGLEPDALVELSVSEGRLVVRPLSEPPYSLDQLLAQLAEHHAHSPVHAEPAVGNESW